MYARVASARTAPDIAGSCLCDMSASRLERGVVYSLRPSVVTLRLSRAGPRFPLVGAPTQHARKQSLLVLVLLVALKIDDPVRKLSAKSKLFSVSRRTHSLQLARGVRQS